MWYLQYAYESPAGVEHCQSYVQSLSQMASSHYHTFATSAASNVASTTALQRSRSVAVHPSIEKPSLACTGNQEGKGCEDIDHFLGKDGSTRCKNNVIPKWKHVYMKLYHLRCMQWWPDHAWWQTLGGETENQYNIFYPNIDVGATGCRQIMGLV